MSNYISSKIWCIIIEKHIKIDDNTSYDLDINFIIDKISIVSNKYFGILHNKDIETREHYHFILYFDNSLSLKRVLLILSTILNIDKSCISASTYLNIRYDMRYLTHKDNKDKYQYSDKEIYTNDIDLYNLYVNDYKDFNINDLINFSNSCKNITEIIQIVGKDYFEKHWRLIIQIFNDVKSSS